VLRARKRSSERIAMALMRSTATAGSVSSSLGMRAWVLAVEEATETEGHFLFTRDEASGERRDLW
jgi:hypothetical protein